MTPGRLFRIVRQRLRSLANPSQLETELERELAFHLEALLQEKIAEGLSPEDARRAARRALGNVSLFQEQCRDQRGVRWLDDMRQDVSYGLRTLRKNPAFTVVVVASLGLGIGANSAVLGVMNAVWRDALPLPDSERLVAIRTVPLDDPAQTRGATIGDFLAWTEQSRSFEAIELTLTGPHELGAEPDGAPAERLPAQGATPGLFRTLGVHPFLGRTFSEKEVRDGSRLVILSHRLWQRRYGGDQSILNKQIPVDGGMSAVIGVMPDNYNYGDPRVEFWVPMNIDRSRLRAGLDRGPRADPGRAPAGAAASASAIPGGRAFAAIARLKPHVPIEQAERDVGAIAANLAAEFPASHAGWGVRVQPLRQLLFGWTREPLMMLETAVALVLLIACANVAALLLARGSVRQREIAMRLALGAGRARIVRQLLTESVLLSLAGGAAGLLVAWWGMRGLTAMGSPIGSPRIAAVDLDFRIVALTGMIAVLTGLVFGLVPALMASPSNPAAIIKESDVATVTRRRHTIRTGLVTAQLALALILLIGFGLLTNSFLRLSGRDLNFDPSGLLTFEFRTDSQQKPIGQYRGLPYFEILGTPSQTLQQVHERLKAIPGAESVGGISFTPVDSLILPVMDVEVEGRSSRAAYFLVTPGFFLTMRTPFVRGRDVSDFDTVSRPWVAIVNETAARQLWPGADPIGRRLTIDCVPEEQSREVIGVVRDIPPRSGQIDPQPVIYASYLQQPSRYRGPYGGMFGQMTFVVRHRNDPLSLVPAARNAVAEIEARPISSVLTAEQRRDLGMRRIRYNLFLVGLLACTAALLAVVGLYGMLAYSVNLRTREIGIRKALGADPRAVVFFVGRFVLALVFAGVAIGLAGAVAMTRLISSQLWGVTPTDPPTFAAVSLLLILAALLACVGPTRRAIAVDPTIALRAE